MNAGDVLSGFHSDAPYLFLAGAFVAVGFVSGRLCSRPTDHEQCINTMVSGSRSARRKAPHLYSARLFELSRRVLKIRHTDRFRPCEFAHDASDKKR